MKPIIIPASQLRLADIVLLKLQDGISPYSFATVKQVKDGWVTLFRPYTHTDDFSYTGGVICYVGVETFEIPADDSPYELCERKELS